MRLILPIILIGCGTSNDVAVEGGTDNKVSATVTVEYVAKQCNDKRFTVEQKLECIRMLTSKEIGLDPTSAEAILETIESRDEQ
jgi:hypothetical protein